MTVFLNAADGPDFYRNAFCGGYAPPAGSQWYHFATIYRTGIPIARTEYSPLVSGRASRVKIELIPGHLRYWLNNEILLEVWDDAPLKMSGRQWLGICTWNTQMPVENFIVSKGEIFPQ